VAQDEGGSIDRDQHGAEPRQHEPQRRESVRITGEDRDSGAFGDAARRETRGQAIAQRVEHRVTPYRVAADDGGLVRKALGAAMQQIGQGLAAKFCVPVAILPDF
jgi:hypothetical protein